MAAASRFASTYLAWFSKPAGDRRVYREIRRRRPERIVELGIGSPRRTVQALRLSQRFVVGDSVHYTGIDLFESRPLASTALPLKTAHQTFKATDARIRLAPGPVGAVLSKWANTLSRTDLLLIGAQFDEEDLRGGWFYLPRMLHAGSLVLRERLDGDQFAWAPLDAAEIARRAAAHPLRRAA